MNPPQVTVDPDVMGGVPVFAGSRLPITTVLASLDKGVSIAVLADSWPFLTEAHVTAAREYQRLHPHTERGGSIGENLPDATVVSSKRVRPPQPR